MLLMITPRSIKRLRNNTGMVILVGSAARFVIRTMAMAPIARPQNNIRFPESMTAISVTGVKKQPCPARAIDSHIKRFFSSFLHQAIKPDQTDTRVEELYVAALVCCSAVFIFLKLRCKNAF